MFSLKTLGGVSVSRDGVPLAGRSTQRRRLALLALLAVARENGLSRDKLLAYLWPERDTERGRHTLAQALYSLRQELGEDVILLGQDDLRLNPAVLASDVAAFEDALAANDLERAVALYGGPFLDGFFISEAPEFERWADAERQRLALRFGRGLESLAVTAAAQGTHRQASEYWRRRAAVEPTNSRVALELMRALAAAGDPAGALQHGRVHARLLREELDVEPDAAVREFEERLRRDVAAARPTAPLQPPPAPPARDVAVTAPLSGAASPALTAPPRRSGRPFRRGRLIGLATVVSLLVFATLSFARRNRSSDSDVPRVVVMGQVRSADTIIGLAIAEALRAELQSVSQIRVLSDARVRETLELMRVAPGTPLDAQLATGVAQRRGASFVVVGSVTPLGTGVQIVAQLIDAQSGAPRITLSERPATPDEMIPAVGRLAARLRAGAAGTPVRDSLPALPALTTSSLAALQYFMQARRMLARSDRMAAIDYLEAALQHDSLFALAHYLAGDLLWYVDRQSHSDAHLSRAFELSARAPLRERLIIRARYEQLVRDRLDSALAYWRLLRASYPDEQQAYEGMAWVYRALGMPAEAAALADTALRLDSSAVAPNVYNRLVSLLAIGDTANALTLVDRYPQGREGALGVRRILMSMRGDWAGVVQLEDSLNPPLADGSPNPRGSEARHGALLALGRLGEAEREMEAIVRAKFMQSPPRVLLAQAWSEYDVGSKRKAAELVRRSFEWIRGADLSPPAYSRLAERTADVAGRLGDTVTVQAVRRFIHQKDAGRGLNSYRYALLTIEAALAAARGDARSAAELAERSRPGMYFGRSVATPMLIQAEALAALGQRGSADSLYHLLLDGPPRFVENDGSPLVLYKIRIRRLLGKTR